MASLKFADIEKLMLALGAELVEGSGSRIAFEMKMQKLFVHRPHPGRKRENIRLKHFESF
ncbi:MAG: type II toxin-antitoxin system HicA family toxin [Pyrinomonadaceae bacterium]